MVKFYASAKFAVDTKNDLKFIFQCGTGVYHKLNEEKMLCTQVVTEKIINNIKRFVGILLKLPTKKYLEKAHIQNFKRKKSFLYEQFL